MNSSRLSCLRTTQVVKFYSALTVACDCLEGSAGYSNCHFVCDDQALAINVKTKVIFEGVIVCLPLHHAGSASVLKVHVSGLCAASHFGGVLRRSPNTKKSPWDVFTATLQNEQPKWSSVQIRRMMWSRIQILREMARAQGLCAMQNAIHGLRVILGHMNFFSSQIFCWASSFAEFAHLVTPVAHSGAVR